MLKFFKKSFGSFGEQKPYGLADFNQLVDQILEKPISAKGIPTGGFEKDPEAQEDLRRRIKKAHQEAYSTWLINKEAMYFRNLVKDFLAGKCPTLSLVETYQFHEELKLYQPQNFALEHGPDGERRPGLKWVGDRLSYRVDHGQGYFTKNTYIPNQISILIEEA